MTHIFIHTLFHAFADPTGTARLRDGIRLYWRNVTAQGAAPLNARMGERTAYLQVSDMGKTELGANPLQVQFSPAVAAL